LHDVRYEIKAFASGWKTTPVAVHLADVRGAILTPFPFLATTAGDWPTVMDYFSYSALHEQGLLGEAPLRDRLARRQIASVVLTQGQWQGDGWEAGGGFWLYFKDFMPVLRANYEPEQVVGMFVILKPRRPDATGSEGTAAP
jgi:hypothetical protein